MSFQIAIENEKKTTYTKSSLLVASAVGKSNRESRVSHFKNPTVTQESGPRARQMQSQVCLEL